VAGFVFRTANLAVADFGFSAKTLLWMVTLASTVSGNRGGTGDFVVGDGLVVGEGDADGDGVVPGSAPAADANARLEPAASNAMEPMSPAARTRRLVRMAMHTFLHRNFTPK